MMKSCLSWQRPRPLQRLFFFEAEGSASAEVLAKAIPVKRLPAKAPSKATASGGPGGAVPVKAILSLQRSLPPRPRRLPQHPRQLKRLQCL